jgi:Tfp pilus assembly protein PilO
MKLPLMMTKLKSHLYLIVEELHRFDWFQLRRWSTWGNWPVPVYGLLCLASLLLVLLVAEFFWQQGQRRTLVWQASAIAALEEQIEAETLRLAARGESPGQLWQQQIILEAFLKSATAVADPLDMLDTLRENAMQHGLDVLSLSPRVVSRDGKIYVYDMALEASGEFLDINNFLNALLIMPVYIGISEFRIQAQERSLNRFKLYADFVVATNPGGLQFVPHSTFRRIGDPERSPVLSPQGESLKPAGFLINDFGRTQLLRGASGILSRQSGTSP